MFFDAIQLLTGQFSKWWTSLSPVLFPNFIQIGTAYVSINFVWKKKINKQEAFREHKHLHVHDFKGKKKKSLSDTFRNEFHDSWLKHTHDLFLCYVVQCSCEAFSKKKKKQRLNLETKTIVTINLKKYCLIWYENSHALPTELRELVFTWSKEAGINVLRAKLYISVPKTFIAIG